MLLPPLQTWMGEGGILQPMVEAPILKLHLPSHHADAHKTREQEGLRVPRGQEVCPPQIRCLT